MNIVSPNNSSTRLAQGEPACAAEEQHRSYPWHSAPQKLRPTKGESPAKIELLNAALERAYNGGNRVSYVLAIIRCSVHRATPADYRKIFGEELVKWSCKNESPPDTDQPAYRLRNFTALFKGWDAFAERSNDPDIVEIVRAAKAEIAASLTRGTWGPVVSLFLRWRLQIGPEKFDETAGQTFEGFCKRNGFGREPLLCAVIAVGKNIGVIPNNPNNAELLHHPEVRAARAAWRAEWESGNRMTPLIDLMGLLNFAGFETTRTALESPPLSLPSRAANLLARFQPTSWPVIASTVQYLERSGFISSDIVMTLEADWNTAFPSCVEPFRSKIARLASERALSHTAIAQALHLQYGASQSLLRLVGSKFADGLQVDEAPCAALAAVVADNLSQFETLLEDAREDYELQHTRTGQANPSPAEVEGYIWGVAPQSANPTDPQPAIPTRETGFARIKQTLTWGLNTYAPKTPAALYGSQLSQRGFEPIRKIIGGAQATMMARAAGTELPALCELRDHVSKLGLEFIPALEINWRNEFALDQVARGTNDLYRVLATLFATEAVSINRYLEQVACLASRKIPYSRVQLALQAISEVGCASHADFSTLLADINLPPDDPRRLFLTLVNSEGSISAALRTFAAQRDFKLSELIEGIDRVVAPYETMDATQLFGLRFPETDSNSSTDPETNFRQKIVRRMTQLPGVTFAEIRGSARPNGDQLVRMSLGRAEQTGSTPGEIALVLDAAMPQLGRSPRDIMQGLAQGITSRVVSPLGLGVLSAKRLEDRDTWEPVVVSAAHMRLESFGASVSPLSVQLWSAGNGQDDLGPLHGNFEAILHRVSMSTGSNRVETTNGNGANLAGLEQQAIQSARRTHLVRTNAALANLALLHAEFHPSQVVALCERNVPGGTPNLVKECGLKYTTVSEIRSGATIPTLPILKRICTLAHVPWRTEYEIGWRLAYAEKCDGNALSRALRTIAASDSGTVEVILTATPRVYGNPEEKLIRAFARAHALEEMKLLHEYRLAKRGCLRDPNWLTTAFTPTPPDQSAPLARPFLEMLSKGRSIFEALRIWGPRFGTNERIRHNIIHALKWAGAPALPKLHDLTSLEEQNTLITWRGALVAARLQCNVGWVSELLIRLPGIRKSELLLIPKLLPMLNVDTSPPEDTVAKRIEVRTAKWTFTAEHRADTFENRLCLLTIVRDDGTFVTADDVLDLIPQLRQQLSTLIKVAGEDTAVGLVCLAGFFRLPNYAWQTLQREGANKLETIDVEATLDNCKQEAQRTGDDRIIGTLDNARIRELIVRRK